MASAKGFDAIYHRGLPRFHRPGTATAAAMGLVAQIARRVEGPVTTGGARGATDLDHPAGTRSADEAGAFTAATAAFEELDEELWR